MTLSDTTAEQAILGAMMLTPSAIETVAEIVTSRDFYRPGHATLYAHLVGSWAAGRPTDPIAMANALTAAGDLARVGGAGYLHDLIATVPTAANAPWYARTVADLARRRRLVEASIRIHAFATNLESTADAAVDASQAELHAATAMLSKGDPASLGDVLDAALERAFDETAQQRGVSTGLGILDDAIGGMKPGHLVIVGGRPGAGKSVLVCDMARAAAIWHGVPTLLFSLEMSRAEVGARILAASCEINLKRIMRGELRADQRQLLTSRADDLRLSPLTVDDTPQLDLGTIRSTARRAAQRRGLGLLIVDYLQLIGTSIRRDNRVQEVAELSTGLKALARELNVPVVAAAQLNRASEIRSDKRPQLSDLRESGQIEADADVVILLHRPDLNDRHSQRAGLVDLILAKNRHGPTDVVTAVAQLEYARFVDGDIPQ